jgi:hypothetical protein
MQRIRMAISLSMLVVAITLGPSWDEQLPIEGSPECNCIDGFTKRAGYYGWDADQRRYRCIPDACHVITE